jgi:transposase
MKSAVLQADWFDPEINPKLAEFCRHYKLHVVPCRPGKPEHKELVSYCASLVLSRIRIG